MKKHALALVSMVAVGVMAVVVVGQAFAAAGSGQSAENRNDDFVVICHYDRNTQGPNAGPHTITINRNALDQHLANHVKKEGFVGDDSIGPCPGDPTPPPPSPSPAVTRTVVSGTPTGVATTPTPGT